MDIIIYSNRTSCSVKGTLYSPNQLQQLVIQQVQPDKYMEQYPLGLHHNYPKSLQVAFLITVAVISNNTGDSQY